MIGGRCKESNLFSQAVLMTEGFPQLSLLKTQHSINYSHNASVRFEGHLEGTWKVSESAWGQGQADD